MSFARQLPEPSGESLIIDCDRCVVRSKDACADCVVSVLLGPPADAVSFDEPERAALDALADSGLVPPLRLVTDDTAAPRPDAG